MVCPEGPIATRSGSSEGLVRAFHGCQFPCGCDGVSCVVSAGGCTAVPAYGAEKIVPGYGAWDMLSACLARLRCLAHPLNFPPSIASCASAISLSARNLRGSSAIVSTSPSALAKLSPLHPTPTCAA
jgi:hypothetical protein